MKNGNIFEIDRRGQKRKKNIGTKIRTFPSFNFTVLGSG